MTASVGLRARALIRGTRSTSDALGAAAAVASAMNASSGPQRCRLVQRRSLPGLATDGRSQRRQLGRVHFLAVRAAGRARDRLVHQRAAEIVRARFEAARRAGRTHLDPRGLHAAQARDAARAARPRASAGPRGTSGPSARVPCARAAPPCARTASGTNSVNPPVLACSAAHAQQVARPVQRRIDVTVHDRRGRPQADLDARCA